MSEDRSWTGCVVLCSELQRSSRDVTSSGHVTSYCSDSIRRYFTSLAEAAATDESVVMTAAGAGDDVTDDVSAAVIKRSFRARVNDAKRSLLQQSDLTGVTSQVKGQECSGSDEGHVGDSEDFMYKDVDELKDRTMSCLDDAVRSQLTVNLAASTSSWRQDSDPRPPPAAVGDSLTFDYVDLAVGGTNSLPQDLREELRLDLRDSTDVLAEPVNHHETAVQPAASAAVLEEIPDNDYNEVVDTRGRALDTPSHHQQPISRQHSDVYRKSSIDVLKPVRSQARPQTAVASVARNAALRHKSASLTAGKVCRSMSAHVLDGRHIGTASANQHSASSSGDHG